MEASASLIPFLPPLQIIELEQFLKDIIRAQVHTTDAEIGQHFLLKPTDPVLDVKADHLTLWNLQRNIT